MMSVCVTPVMAIVLLEFFAAIIASTEPDSVENRASDLHEIPSIVSDAATADASTQTVSDASTQTVSHAAITADASAQTESSQSRRSSRKHRRNTLATPDERVRHKSHSTRSQAAGVSHPPSAHDATPDDAGDKYPSVRRQVGIRPTITSTFTSTSHADAPRGGGGHDQNPPLQNRHVVFDDAHDTERGARAAETRHQRAGLHSEISATLPSTSARTSGTPAGSRSTHRSRRQRHPAGEGGNEVVVGVGNVISLDPGVAGVRTSQNAPPDDVPNCCHSANHKSGCYFRDESDQFRYCNSQQLVDFDQRAPHQDAIRATVPSASAEGLSARDGDRRHPYRTGDGGHEAARVGYAIPLDQAGAGGRMSADAQSYTRLLHAQNQRDSVHSGGAPPAIQAGALSRPAQGRAVAGGASSRYMVPPAGASQNPAGASRGQKFYTDEYGNKQLGHAHSHWMEAADQRQDQYRETLPPSTSAGRSCHHRHGQQRNEAATGATASAVQGPNVAGATASAVEALVAGGSAADAHGQRRYLPRNRPIAGFAQPLARRDDVSMAGLSSSSRIPLLSAASSTTAIQEHPVRFGGRFGRVGQFLSRVLRRGPARPESGNPPAGAGAPLQSLNEEDTV